MHRKPYPEDSASTNGSSVGSVSANNLLAKDSFVKVVEGGGFCVARLKPLGTSYPYQKCSLPRCHPWLQSDARRVGAEFRTETTFVVAALLEVV